MRERAMRDRVQGERVTLLPSDRATTRAIVAGDTDALAAVLPGLTAARGWPHADTLDAMRSALAAGGPHDDPWLIVLDDGGPIVIGDIGWKGAPDPSAEAREVEIGYGLAAPYRGRGYGSDAVGALVGWLRTRPYIARIIAEVELTNVASRRVLERAGLALERIEGAMGWYALATSPRRSPTGPPTP